MFSLKSDEHLFKMSKDLYQDKQFYDLICVTNGSSFYGHSGLIFYHIPWLLDLVYQGCRTGHQNIVVSLSEVKPELMEIALQEFYLNGDPYKLKNVLNLNNLENGKEKLETEWSNKQLDVDAESVKIDKRQTTHSKYTETIVMDTQMVMIWLSLMNL